MSIVAIPLVDFLIVVSINGGFKVGLIDSGSRPVFGEYGPCLS